MKPLVSILTPCYNGERKVKFFLESILNQTYDNIEFIIVNDGSIDKTEEILLSYEKFFKKRGYKFIYLKQNNSGPGAALNNGLKYFSGDYLMWPDSDDILSPTHVEEKVNYLENNKDKGLVFCNVNIVEENNIKKVIQKKEKILYNDRKKNFEDILLNGWSFSGAWMIRTKDFLKINPDRNIIIITGEGQNWQLLLPMAWNYDMGKINHYLYTCVIYKDSHSHKKETYEKFLYRINNIINGINEILKDINMEKSIYEYYKSCIADRFSLMKLNMAIDYLNKEDSKKIYDELSMNNVEISLKIKIKYYLNQYGIYRYIKNIKNK